MLSFYVREINTYRLQKMLLILFLISMNISFKRSVIVLSKFKGVKYIVNRIETNVIGIVTNPHPFPFGKEFDSAFSAVSYVTLLTIYLEVKKMIPFTKCPC